jgi:hypothetical protein
MLGAKDGAIFDAFARTLGVNPRSRLLVLPSSHRRAGFDLMGATGQRRTSMTASIRP